MELKYLFGVEYTDGSVFYQTQEDVSANDPKKSAFTDVLESGKDIKFFALSDGANTVMIDLPKGKFVVNGVTFIAEGDRPLPAENPDYKLIYYRQVQRDFNMETKEETAVRVKYFIGWQCTIAGKNYQQVIGID